jgi:hypothetical protein
VTTKFFNASEFMLYQVDGGGVVDFAYGRQMLIRTMTTTGSQASAQANWVTSSVQSGSSVLLWNCGDIVTAIASGSWASQYAPARTAMITTTASVDAGRQIAAWFDRTVRDNAQADADVQYTQSIASPGTQLAVSATQRGNQYATSSTNTSNDLSTDLDTSGANIQSTSAAVEKTAAIDSATAWKAYQVALASLDEGAATTAVEKAYQDALAQVTRNSRVAYANLTYTEGVAQIGSVGDAITDMGQTGKTYVTNLAGDEKTFTDTAAPIIGARTLLYTEADNDLRKAITTADNVWRNGTAQAWGTHTAGDLVARGNVRRTLANTSSLVADASQASIAELKAQWWQNEIPNYLQWSVDIGGIETTYTNNTTANILLRTTGVKNAGVTYASTVGTAIQAYETTTATAREQYLSTLMTIGETAAEATLRADRDKEIALADADLQKQLTGNESAHTNAVNNANSAHSTATANAEAARKSAEQAALTQLNSTLAQATKDKEALIAGAERTYDQTVASLDAQYGSESSNGDTGVEGATRRSAIKTRDAQYYAARDTSWANTLSGSTTVGTSPWTVKAISAANAQAAYSTSRASAQAAHDAAMLDAMEDWKDATSTSTLTKLAAQANGSEMFNNAVSNAFGNWEEFLGNVATNLPGEMVLTENATVSFSPDEPMVQSPNIPIPGGPDDLGNRTPRAGELPGTPSPTRRSWFAADETWFRSEDGASTEDSSWWQFGRQIGRGLTESNPLWQFNELVQSGNEYLGRPIYVNEFAHAIDGSTQNYLSVFSWGATDYVGSTDSQAFQGWEWSWQRGLFTASRELLIIAYTGTSRAFYTASTGAMKYAWGGVWLAGVGYDAYGAGSSAYESYVAFRNGDIVGGFWHAGFSALSAFGVGAGLRSGSSLGKVADDVPSGNALDFSASKNGIGTSYTKYKHQGPWYWRTLEWQETVINPNLTGLARAATEAHEYIHWLSNLHLPLWASQKKLGGRPGLRGFIGSNVSFYEEVVAYGVEFWIRGELDEVLTHAWNSANKYDQLVGAGSSNIAKRHILTGAPFVVSGAGISIGYLGYHLWESFPWFGQEKKKR